MAKETWSFEELFFLLLLFKHHLSIKVLAPVHVQQRISNSYDCQHLYLRNFLKANKYALILVAMGTCSASANTNTSHGHAREMSYLQRNQGSLPHQHPPLFPVLHLCCFKNTGKVLKRFTVYESSEGPFSKVSSAAQMRRPIKLARPKATCPQNS